MMQTRTQRVNKLWGKGHIGDFGSLLKSKKVSTRCSSYNFLFSVGYHHDDSTSGMHFCLRRTTSFPPPPSVLIAPSIFVQNLVSPPHNTAGPERSQLLRKTFASSLCLLRRAFSSPPPAPLNVALSLNRSVNFCAKPWLATT